jgi:hypothetical protein
MVLSSPQKKLHGSYINAINITQEIFLNKSPTNVLARPRIFHKFLIFQQNCFLNCPFCKGWVYEDPIAKRVLSSIDI